MKTFTEYTELLNNTFTKKDVIAPVESSSEASKAYVVGEKFFYNNILYEATDVIASGGIIDPGTNCEEAEDIVSQIENKTVVTDAVPTQGSTNPVQSGGVYDSLDPIYNVLGAKNILPNIAETKTVCGVTRTANTDGSITLNGTSTSWGQSDVLKGLLPKGTYKISVGTPLPSNVWATLRNEDTSTSILNIGNGSSTVEGSFTLSSDTNVRLFCGITEGATLNNFTFYPMIRLASIQDDTYVPYSMTNQEMTPYVQAISNCNLLDNPWFTVNQRGVTTASGNNTYTVDRWMLGSSEITFTLANDGKSFSLTNYSTVTPEFRQRFENDYAEKYLDGRTLTLSIMKDGIVYSATDTYDYSTNATLCSIDMGDAYCQIRNLASQPSRFFVRIIFKAGTQNKTVSGIQAMKLELGPVSTLAMDTAPNYAEELLKCQRYFKRILIGERIGRVNNGGTTIRFGLDEVETMRINPTATEIVDAQTGINISGAGVQFWLTKTTDYTVSAERVGGIILTLTETGAAKVASYTNQIVGIWNYNQYLDISADL